MPVHGAIERQPGPHGELHRLAVEHRQGARLSGAHGAHLRVGRGPVFGRAAAEELAARVQLDMRFKADDGSAFPEWEEKKLSSQCTIKKGSQLNKEHLTNEGAYPALNGGVNPSGYTTDWNTEENTITISEGGNSCGYVNFVATRFWSGGHNYSLQELKKSINVRYLYQYLKFNELRIMRLRVGSGLPNIQKGEVSNFKITLPCIEEQEKIANFLSSIDSKVEQVQKQLDSTKEFKKALLQQMFV